MINNKFQVLNKINWLSFFRVGIASLCLFNFLSLQFDFDSLFGSTAYAPSDISYLLSDSYIPSFHKIYIFLSKYANLEFDSLLLIFRIAYPVALVALLIGLFSRLAALLSLILLVIFTNSYKDRKSTRLNSSHIQKSRMPSSA